MIIKINGEIPQDESLSIKINNEMKMLTDTNPFVSFTVNEKKQYKIEIEQSVATSNRTPLSILFFVLTAIIQGVFNTLLLNTNSKWYNEIRAYCLKANLLIDVQQDTDIRLTYKNSTYDIRTQKWSLPVFTVKPNVVSDISFVINPCDFSNQYFNYVKRVVSVFSSIMLVFAVILYTARTHLNVFIIIFVSILLFGLTILTVILCVSQHKKLGKLYQSFVEQNLDRI